MMIMTSPQFRINAPNQMHWWGEEYDLWKSPSLSLLHGDGDDDEDLDDVDDIWDDYDDGENDDDEDLGSTDARAIKLGGRQAVFNIFSIFVFIFCLHFLNICFHIFSIFSQ